MIMKTIVIDNEMKINSMDVMMSCEQWNMQ